MTRTEASNFSSTGIVVAEASWSAKSAPLGQLVAAPSPPFPSSFSRPHRKSIERGVERPQRKREKARNLIRKETNNERVCFGFALSSSFGTHKIGQRKSELGSKK